MSRDGTVVPAGACACAMAGPGRAGTPSSRQQMSQAPRQLAPGPPLPRTLPCFGAGRTRATPAEARQRRTNARAGADIKARRRRAAAVHTNRQQARAALAASGLPHRSRLATTARPGAGNGRTLAMPTRAGVGEAERAASDRVGSGVRPRPGGPGLYGFPPKASPEVRESRETGGVLVASATALVPADGGLAGSPPAVRSGAGPLTPPPRNACRPAWHPAGHGPGRGSPPPARAA